MSINVTFVIQFVNFWITYLFVSRLVYKQFIIRIEKKEKEFAYAQEKVEKEQKLLEFMKIERENRIRLIQEYAKDSYQLPCSIKIQIPENIPLEKRESHEQLSENIHEFLTKKIQDAY